MKLLIIIILPLILLIGAGAGAAFYGLIPNFGFLPVMDAEARQREEAEAKRKLEEQLTIPPPPYSEGGQERIFYQIDEFVSNLRPTRHQPVFALLSVTLELKDQSVQPTAAAYEPRIRDAVNVYLSSLTVEQLNGYDGIQMVRQQIWARLNRMFKPGDLTNIQISKLTVK